ncbi:MAG: hypothetical protein U0168_27445 [Nannocystaceae bacterium]
MPRVRLSHTLWSPPALALACGVEPDGAAAFGSSSDAVATAATASSEASGANADAGPVGEADSAGSDDAAKFDVGGEPTPVPPCGCGSSTGRSAIWISLSNDGVVAKLDTDTLVEAARYVTRSDGAGDPSRTSVSLGGSKAAVANRNGGVAKFWADVDDCEDNNGSPGIQTSSGAGDVLAWGEEDCMAWYLPLNCSSNRPVAWTRGVFDEASCSWIDAKLWTVCDADVLLLNGDTGEIEETIVLDGGFPFVYGGAADADGNFWGLDTGGSRIFRIDHEDYSMLAFALPPSGGYGITVDSEGRPWVCGGGGVSRFNLDDSTWDSTGTSGIGGCMTDGDQLIWHSNPSGTLLGFNIETLAVDEMVQLPEYVHGVSVDFYGYVWGVGFANNNAYRADPQTGQVDAYNGLTGAYTYSDMTGFALSTAGGGVVPSG